VPGIEDDLLTLLDGYTTKSTTDAAQLVQAVHDAACLLGANKSVAGAAVEARLRRLRLAG
jgi:hypothetical protein